MNTNDSPYEGLSNEGLSYEDLTSNMTDDEILSNVKPYYTFVGDKTLREHTEKFKEFLRSDRITEELKYKLLGVNEHVIEYFNNVSEALKKEAITRSFWVINTMIYAGIHVSDDLYIHAYETGGAVCLCHINAIPIALQKRSIEDLPENLPAHYPVFLPLAYYSDEMISFFLERFPSRFREVPAEKLTVEFIAKALASDGLGVISRLYAMASYEKKIRKMITPEMIKIAIKQNPLSLGPVLSHETNDKKAEYIELAIDIDGLSIQCVEPKDRTEELEIRAVKSNPRSISAIINPIGIGKMARKDPDRTKFLKILTGIAINLQPDIVETIPIIRNKETIKLMNIRRVEILRLQICEICVGLQGLGLPALVTMFIIDATELTHSELLIFYEKWKVITKVKHFLPSII